MSIWNKVLVGLIGVATVVLFYCAARTLKTHASWRSAANRYEQDIAAAQQQQQRLVEGTGDSPGIRQLENELHSVLIERGRVWYNGAVGQIDPNTGGVSVTIESPAPHQINENLVLYAFDGQNLEPGGQYLGEFRVSGVAEKQVALLPVHKLLPAELERLQKSTGPWTLYEMFPADDHQVFAGLTDKERAVLLPEATRQEYAKDGQPADPNDPPERVLDGKYDRQLRDYALLFHEFNRLRSIYVDLITAAQKDKGYLTGALADAKGMVDFRVRQIADGNVELKKFAAEKDAVIAHRDLLAAQLSQARRAIGALLAQNKKLAADLARRQFDAAGRIDQAAAAALRAD